MLLLHLMSLPRGGGQGRPKAAPGGSRRSRTRQWAFRSTPPHSADDHPGFPEAALGLARRMGQGHGHLPRPAAILPDVVLDRGVSAIETVFVPEPLEDAIGRVALLPRTSEAVLQDPVDDAGVGLLLSLSKGWDAGADSHGLCAPLGDTECRIRETANYIEDAQRLVEGEVP